MLKNYLVIAFRSLKRNKVYSFINIFGLAIGMACCIVIILFVKDELSYDRFHENAGRIYRLTVKRKIPTGEQRDTFTPSNAGPNMVSDFPEVVDAVRLDQPRVYIVEHGDKRFTTDPVGADPSILDVFTFPLVIGDKRTALKDPDNVVISEGLAEKMFGDENPMGKVITLYGVDPDERHDYTVTGIMKDIPQNSHLRFEFLVPREEEPSESARARPGPCVTYLLLDKNADPKELEKKLPEFTLKYYGERYAQRAIFRLQPLTSIHLRSDLDYDEIVEKKGNISNSYSLSAVALIILLIAIINFMNLSTARASRRSREVGIRRVVGASRFKLFRQFLSESTLFSLVALLLAMALALLVLPFFNSLMEKHLTLNLKSNPLLCAGFFFLSLLVGLLSGSYPALLLSSYRPVDVLKGEVKKGTRFGIFLRSGLVVFQFALSLVFIIGTIIIFEQLDFIKNKDLGFDKENIIEIPIFRDNAFTKRSELIKRELGQHPNILKVVVSSGAPGNYNGWLIPCVPEGFSEENPVEMRGIPVGEDYFSFFGIPIVEGRDFSKEIASDADSAVIINQAAAKFLGWDSPIGKQIKSEEFSSESNKAGIFSVIGVVRDFHNGSLHEKIEPTIYKYLLEFEHNVILLKIKAENTQETIAFLERKWRELPTYLIFNYQFLDESLQRYRYGEEKKISKIFTFSSILAILLACLGVFGLASFSAERRTKEIGIRKVLGASVSNIAFHFVKDFSILVLTADVVACPVGYYIMNRWLQNFAYRISIGWWAFVAAFLFVFLITILTISFQSIKAATLNPATTLRYE